MCASGSTPVTDGTLVHTDDGTYRIDLSSQILELSLDEIETSSRNLAPRIRMGKKFVSAAALAMKAKQFDDGLYASVELMAQRGKRELLRELSAALDADAPTTALLAAARIVSGENVDEPLQSRGESIAHEFLNDEKRSKPIGFYTWSEELARIFRQDRLLQSDIATHTDLEQVARAIHAQPHRRGVYEMAVHLAEGLTNPLAMADLRPMLRSLDSGESYQAPKKLALLPPSVAHETELVRRLFDDKPIPDGFDLMKELIRRVRAGTMDLTPRESSGWYDWQTWSLETLADPKRARESAKLVLDPAYAKHLEDLFKGALTLTRETHIKQLEIPVETTASPFEEFTEPPTIIFVQPALRVEPLPTYYARRADCYRYVRDLLEKIFGADLQSAPKRVRETGSARLPLVDEIAWMERLFRSAAVTAEQDLGIRVDGDTTPFTEWAATAGRDDEDLAEDARAMVPVFFDKGREMVKAWLFLGWINETLEVSFSKVPLVWDVNPKEAEIAYVPASFEMSTPVVQEVYVSRILDRDEFRRLCDREKTQERIIAALQ